MRAEGIPPFFLLQGTDWGGHEDTLNFNRKNAIIAGTLSKTFYNVAT